METSEKQMMTLEELRATQQIGTAHIPSFYINFDGEEVERSEIHRLLGAKKTQERAIMLVIEKMCNGDPCTEFFRPILEKVVTSPENKMLKKLFYYFLELASSVDSDEMRGQMLLMLNYIITDVKRTKNEYVKEFVLKKIPDIHIDSSAEFFIQAILENTTLPEPEIRRAAYYALLQTYLRAPDLLPEIGEMLYMHIKKETDPQTTRQLFVILNMVDSGRALQFYREVDLALVHPEVLYEIMKIAVEQRDAARICEMLAFRDQNIVLELALLVMAHPLDQATTRKASAVLAEKLPSIETTHVVKRKIIDSWKKLSTGFLDIPAILASFVKLDVPNNNEILGELLALLVHAVNNIDAKALCAFLETAYEQMQEKIQTHLAAKNTIIASVLQIHRRFGFVGDKIIALIGQSLKSFNCPEIVYGACKMYETLLYRRFAVDEIIEILIVNIPFLRYGKIVRCVLSILGNYIEKEEHVDLFANTLEKHLEKDSFLRTLVTTEISFVPSAIVMALAMICKKVSGERAQQLRSLAEKMRGFSKQEQTETISQLITAFAQAGIDADIVYGRAEPAENKAVLARRSVFEFENVLGLKEAQRRKTGVVWMAEIAPHARSTIGNIFKCSSINDPIYCEAIVTKDDDVVTFDFLLVNQTEYLINNVFFEFVMSDNIRHMSARPQIMVEPETFAEVRHSFKITEPFSGFIGGSIVYYVKRLQIYQNIAMTQFSILDFLCELKMSFPEFRKLWPHLMWENSYAISFGSATEDMVGAWQAIEKRLQLSKTIDVAIECKGDRCFIANYTTQTKNGVPVLMNVKISSATKNNRTRLVCVMRSVDNSIVSAIAKTLSELLKGKTSTN